MGLVDRVNTALAETRVIGGVPWQPWNDPWQRFDTGGPAHPSRSGAGGVDGALALQPVYSCVRFIAEGVGKTPVLQYRDTGSRKVKMPPGPFITSPSNYLRPFDWKVVGMTSVLLQGMGIALVTSRDGYQYPLSAEWLSKDQVTIVDSQPFNPVKTKYYYAGRPVAREDLFIIRGLSVPGRTEAISPLRAFQAYIESGHSALEYGNGWYKSGGFPPGVFRNSQYEVTDEQSSEIKGRLVRAIRRHEPLVHGSDWEFSPITVPPNEAQFIQSMQLNATQIASIYGAPPPHPPEAGRPPGRGPPAPPGPGNAEAGAGEPPPAPGPRREREGKASWLKHPTATFRTAIPAIWMPMVTRSASPASRASNGIPSTRPGSWPRGRTSTRTRTPASTRLSSFRRSRDGSGQR